MSEEVVNLNSILDTTKALMGIGSDYTHFDTDMILHINSVFMILNQMGVGPDKPFTITSSDETWDQFINGEPYLEGVKTYMYQKCRLVFDPPASSVLVDAINKSISELEWRLYTAKATYEKDKE